MQDKKKATPEPDPDPDPNPRRKEKKSLISFPLGFPRALLFSSHQYAVDPVNQDLKKDMQCNGGTKQLQQTQQHDICCC